MVVSSFTLPRMDELNQSTNDKLEELICGDLFAGNLSKKIKNKVLIIKLTS